jgi:hypothetical protein
MKIVFSLVISICKSSQVLKKVASVTNTNMVESCWCEPHFMEVLLYLGSICCGIISQSWPDNCFSQNVKTAILCFCSHDMKHGA